MAEVSSYSPFIPAAPLEIALYVVSLYIVKYLNRLHLSYSVPLCRWHISGEALPPPRLSPFHELLQTLRLLQEFPDGATNQL